MTQLVRSPKQQPPTSATSQPNKNSSNGLKQLTTNLIDLASLYGQELAANQLRLYALALNDLNGEQLEKGFQTALRESKFWPRPSELREYCTGVTAQSTASTKAAGYWSWVIRWALVYLQGHRYTITGGADTYEFWARSLDDLSYFKTNKTFAEHDLSKAQEHLTRYQNDSATLGQWSDQAFAEQLDFCTRVDRFLAEIADKVLDDRSTGPAYLAEAITTLEGFIAESKQLPKIVNQDPDDYFGGKLSGPLFALRYYYIAAPPISVKSYAKPVLSSDLTQYRESFRAAVQQFQTAQAKYDTVLNTVYEMTIASPPVIPPAIEAVLIQLEGSVEHALRRIRKFIKTGDDKYLRRTFEQYALVVASQENKTPYASPARLLGCGAETDEWRVSRFLVKWVEEKLVVIPND